VLTGFMGTGKSEVGAILAELLGREHIDTDQLVEEAEGLKISEVFDRFGEPHFRDRESKAIAALSSYPPGSLVISTGGGAVLLEENRRMLRKDGLIILLTASSLALRRRIKKSGERPLLSEGSVGRKIEQLLREREHLYKECDLSIDTTGISRSRVAREIIKHLEF
jgi:shikimate kinase